MFVVLKIIEGFAFGAFGFVFCAIYILATPRYVQPVQRVRKAIIGAGILFCCDLAVALFCDGTTMIWFAIGGIIPVIMLGQELICNLKLMIND